MTEPKNYEEYLARFHKGTRVTGFGLANVTQHVACPFCAAPDNVSFRVIDVDNAMAKGATCSECQRGWRGLVMRGGGGVSIEIVQTAGPDQPEWLLPVMRRVESDK